MGAGDRPCRSGPADGRVASAETRLSGRRGQRIKDFSTAWARLHGKLMVEPVPAGPACWPNLPSVDAAPERRCQDLCATRVLPLPGGRGSSLAAHPGAGLGGSDVGSGRNRLRVALLGACPGARRSPVLSGHRGLPNRTHGGRARLLPGYRAIRSTCPATHGAVPERASPAGPLWRTSHPHRRRLLPPSSSLAGADPAPG